jgi:hypothetical protein
VSAPRAVQIQKNRHVQPAAAELDKTKQRADLSVKIRPRRAGHKSCCGGGVSCRTAPIKGWKIRPSHYVNQDLATIWLDKWGSEAGKSDQQLPRRS